MCMNEIRQMTVMGIPYIIWNRVSDRRKSKRKRVITKCRFTVCRSIEKRHDVWARARVACAWLLFLQDVFDIWWCRTAVTVIAQTSYCASYFDKKPMMWFWMGGYIRWLWKEQDYSSCIILHPMKVRCCILSRTKQQWVTIVNSWQNKWDKGVAVVRVRNLRMDAIRRSSK